MDMFTIFAIGLACVIVLALGFLCLREYLWRRTNRRPQELIGSVQRESVAMSRRQWEGRYVKPTYSPPPRRESDDLSPLIAATLVSSMVSSGYEPPSVVSAPTFEGGSGSFGGGGASGSWDSGSSSSSSDSSSSSSSSDSGSSSSAGSDGP